MPDEIALLREYALTKSSDAFAHLANQYVNLVYAAARRQVRDSDLAEDVTQAVFIVLARKAGSIPTDRPLSAWLIRTTGYCAANVCRSRARRKLHERRAAAMAPIQSSDDASWDELAPLLDEGMAKLGAKDRDALLLKFFEAKSLRQVGEALGVSEEAAGKRVSRAVDKLRAFFVRRGATVSAAALVTLLASESAHAAPAAVATLASTASAASTGSTVAATAAKGAIAAMAIQKTTVVAAAGLLLLLGVGGGAVYLTTASSVGTPRTVSIPPPKPATTSVYIAANTVSFPNGTTVQLLGMTEIAQERGGIAGFFATARASDTPRNADTAVWWTPNGENTPPVRTRGEVTAGADSGQRALRLVAAQTDAVPGDADVTLQIKDGNLGASSSSRDNNRTIHNAAFIVPDDLEHTDVKIGVASGAWREDASIALATTTQPTTRTTGPNVFTTITEEKGMTVVQMKSPRGLMTQDRNFRIVAVLKNGKEVGNREWSSNALGISTLKFPCKKDDVVRIAWTSRPYTWATLGHVALKPAAATTQSQIPQVGTSGNK